jgi:8-oxo-dGTP pyrophosphatase MutT (NUDIX family)
MSAPRLAASVILVRPGRTGFELYMTRRSAGSGFAPDAFVFPGGAVEAQDENDAVKARTLGIDGERLIEERVIVGAALAIAALRELFEEAGILIARSSDGSPVGRESLLPEDVASERKQLCDGTLAFEDFLRRHDWYADARALKTFSHWITPPSEPRRYDTYFFLATAPFDQAAKADAFETHEGVWIAPAEALRRSRSGSFHLVFPTIKHLERLAALDSLGSALEFARTKSIVTITPAAARGTFDLPAELESTW